MVLEEKKIISFAWKWLGERRTRSLALPDFPKTWKRDKRDNSELMLFLHALISEADIVVAHNANFDDKMAAADFITLGLKPPSPHKTVCTLKVARSVFKFSSNKLDDLGQRLGVGRKIQTGGFKLWKACMDGSVAAYAKLKRYNRGDVDLLERIYLKLRPWMRNHPQVGTLTVDRCPACRGQNLTSRGRGMNKQGAYRKFQCNDCGHWVSGASPRARR